MKFSSLVSDKFCIEKSQSYIKYGNEICNLFELIKRELKVQVSKMAKSKMVFILRHCETATVHDWQQRFPGNTQIGDASKIITVSKSLKNALRNIFLKNFSSHLTPIQIISWLQNLNYRSYALSVTNGLKNIWYFVRRFFKPAEGKIRSIRLTLLEFFIK